jgi:hypothetical protein
MEIDLLIVGSLFGWAIHFLKSCLSSLRPFFKCGRPARGLQNESLPTPGRGLVCLALRSGKEIVRDYTMLLLCVAQRCATSDASERPWKDIAPFLRGQSSLERISEQMLNFKI